MVQRYSPLLSFGKQFLGTGTMTDGTLAGSVRKSFWVIIGLKLSAGIYEIARRLLLGQGWAEGVGYL